ncbi:AsnC family transcriptional regulator [Candidatus Acidianus copahuensis]|uniref:AsnC family transcriptional regulator n=1 Tax=Candidatus Acidianus copahuensis TaxID=1160895 RepID=A0A031LMG1_9CREN|nr:Lrp/AsnC ligand binding domain-containing protein [Candidatus Acidianus copahuensis]EZQ03055.1 AsnC family transcriptional regulator [Candidatus Acidianus copahuensis]
MNLNESSGKPVSAIVLVNTDAGGEEEVYNRLREMKEVSQVFIVYGVYDVVAVVEASDMETLRNFISSSIRKIPKVRSTLTMIIMESKLQEKA